MIRDTRPAIDVAQPPTQPAIEMPIDNVGYRALTAYSAALYSVCSGREGTQRQERGYRELYAFLAYRAVSSALPTQSDSIQRAIEQIHRNLAHCRRPEVFIAFALQAMREAVHAGQV